MNKIRNQRRIFGAHWLAFLPAISDTNVDQAKLAAAVRSAKECGAELFELACHPISGLSAHQTATALKAGGITNASYCRFYPGDESLGDPLGSGNPYSDAIKTFEEDLRFIEDLRAMGITVRYMTGPNCFVLGKKYDQGADAIVQYARDFYQRFNDTASRIGDLTVCLEYLRPSEDHAVETLDRVREIADGFPWLRWHADVFHMLERKENPAEIIRNAGPLLGYLHAHGSKRVSPGMNAGENPDEWDRVNWADIATALNEIGYEGPVVPEPFGEAIRKQVPALGEGLPPATDPSMYYRGALEHFRKVGILSTPTTS